MICRVAKSNGGSASCPSRITAKLAVCKGRMADDRHLVDRKKLHAVAEFVVRYVGFIREVLGRHRGPRQGFSRSDKT